MKDITNKAKRMDKGNTHGETAVISLATGGIIK